MSAREQQRVALLDAAQRLEGRFDRAFVICPQKMEEFMSDNARIYLRKNGSFGASCDGTLDTAHEIQEDSGRFTVWSVGDPDVRICRGATRYEAERAIANDWRAFA